MNHELTPAINNVHQEDEDDSKENAHHKFQKEVKWSAKPVELNFPSELDNLLSTDDNAVIYFYKPQCPFCAKFKPIYDSLANDIHRTNLNPSSVPIVFAEIDGHKWKNAINRLRPGFLGDPVNKRGYPTILFKRKDGTAITWDPELPRTDYNIAALMSLFFQDPTLIPIFDNLYDLMNNPQPEFIYFYSDNTSIIPRFNNDLDPYFVGQENAVKSMNYSFFINPDLAKKGAAFPINSMDRSDLKIPLIYDTRENKEYAYRDAHKWMIHKLNNTEGTTNFDY